MGWYGQGRGTLAIVLPPPVIATTSLPNATAGSPYSTFISAIHGTPPYTFALLSGQDANGFPAFSSSGVLSGTPTSDETLNLVFQVTDSLNVPSAPTSLTLSVVGVIPQIFNATLPNAIVNSPYNTVIGAINGQPPYTYTILSGQDVNGFPAISASGTLSGTPASIESLNIVFQATDSLGSTSAPTSLTLGVVAAPPIFYISSTAPNTNIGTGFGTLANPWNIAALNDPTSRGMYAGNTVQFLNGTYNLNAAINATTSGSGIAPVYNIQGGTATSPTVVIAQTNRGVILNGFANNDGITYPTGSAPMLGQAFSFATGQQPVTAFGNLVIDGFYMTGGSGGFVIYDAQGITATATVTGYVFQNCETFNTTGSSFGNLGHFKTRFAAGTIVQNNVCHGTYASTGTLLNSSVIFSFNSINGIYQYNTLYDSPTTFHLKNIHQNNDTLQFNYIELNGPNGTLTTPTHCIEDCTGGDVGTTTTVINNILVVPASGGGALWWNGSDAQGSGGFQTDATYCTIVFANNTCISSGAGGMFIQCVGDYVGQPGGVVGTPPAKHHMYNNLFISTGAYVQNNFNGLIAQCAGSNCQGVQDYNIYSCTNPTTFSVAQTRVAPAFSESNPLSNYTVAQWKALIPGIEGHSTFATISPNSLFTNPNVTLTPNGYQLTNTSQAKGYGRAGGVVTGTAVDAGAWGGPSPPTQIGSNLAPLLFMGNSMQGMSLALTGSGSGSTFQNFTGTDTKYDNVLPIYPLSPWGGTANFTDGIQIIYSGASYNSDITNAIITDNTVPAGVSSSVCSQTLISPSTGSQQNSYICHPSISAPQGMLYQSIWFWLQADMTSRGPDFEQEFVEFKTPDGNGTFFGPERFQVLIFQANNSHGFSTTLPNFVFTHNSEVSNGSGLYTYMSASLAPNSSFTSKNYTAGFPKANVAVPLGRWAKLEWAFNRSDASGQGWMWVALTDPGSSDPQLQAGTTIFQTRGAFNYTDTDTGQSWTNGMNTPAAFGGLQPPGAFINRLFLCNLTYGGITRSSTSTYEVRWTDVQVYAGWPPGATAHPSNYK